MSIAFATFVERLSEDTVRLKFDYWYGSTSCLVHRLALHHTNYEPYTQEEYNDLNIESLNETPCVFSTFVNSEYLDVLGIPANPDEFARQQLQKTNVDSFLDRAVSFAWVEMCKRYDPTLSDRITRRIAEKLNITTEVETQRSDYQRFKNLFDAIGITYTNCPTSKECIWIHNNDISIPYLEIVFEEGKFKAFHAVSRI